MAKAASWGGFLVIFTVIGILLATASAFFLRKTHKRRVDQIVFAVGLVLVLLETYKQLFYFFVVNDREYYWWIFPFQLCSIPIYLCVIAPLLRDGRLKATLYDFIGSFGLLGGVIVYAATSGMIYKFWTLTLHSYTWHFLLIFVGLLLGLTGNVGTQKHGFRRTVFMYLGLCVIALCINLIFWERAGGNINMFYIGPMITYQPVFHDISEQFGWYINAPVYIACSILGAYIFYLPFRLKANRRIAR